MVYHLSELLPYIFEKIISCLIAWLVNSYLGEVTMNIIAIAYNKRNDSLYLCENEESCITLPVIKSQYGETSVATIQRLLSDVIVGSIPSGSIEFFYKSQAVKADGLDDENTFEAYIVDVSELNTCEDGWYTEWRGEVAVQYFRDYVLLNTLEDVYDKL